MSYSLNSLRGLYRGFYRGVEYRDIKGDTRSLDYSSNAKANLCQKHATTKERLLNPENSDRHLLNSFVHVST